MIPLEHIISQTNKIKQLQLIVLQLDLEFLTMALQELKDTHEAEEIIDTISQLQKIIGGIKIKQLELFVEIARNTDKLITAETELRDAKIAEPLIEQL